MRIVTVLIVTLALAVGMVPPLTAATAPDLEQGLEQVAKTLVEGLATQDVRKIAVIEFTSLAGYRSTLGPFIAEELTTQLLTLKPGAFDVVERQQLAKVLAEQSLSSSALFDAETIATVGKVLGIQAIITGTTADLGDDVKIHARCISVATAKVFAAAATRVPKLGTVDSLMRQGAAPGSSGAGPASSTGRSQAQASDVYFQNDLLRLTVSSVGASADGKSISLALLAENLNSTPLALAVEAEGVYAKARYAHVTLVDEFGTEYSLEDFGGVSFYIPSRSPAGGFTSIAGKSRTTLTLRFRSQSSSRSVGKSGSKDAPKGPLSLGIRFLVKSGEGITRFSAGLSNIQLQAPR